MATEDRSNVGSLVLMDKIRQLESFILEDKSKREEMEQQLKKFEEEVRIQKEEKMFLFKQLRKVYVDRATDESFSAFELSGKDFLDNFEEQRKEIEKLKLELAIGAEKVATIEELKSRIVILEKQNSFCMSIAEKTGVIGYRLKTSQIKETELCLENKILKAELAEAGKKLFTYQTATQTKETPRQIDVNDESEMVEPPPKIVRLDEAPLDQPKMDKELEIAEDCRVKAVKQKMWLMLEEVNFDVEIWGKTVEKVGGKGRLRVEDFCYVRSCSKPEKLGKSKKDRDRIERKIQAYNILSVDEKKMRCKTCLKKRIICDIAEIIEQGVRRKPIDQLRKEKLEQKE